MYTRLIKSLVGCVNKKIEQIERGEYVDKGGDSDETICGGTCCDDYDYSML